MIDVHVHLAALPEGENGCWVSETMSNGWLAKWVVRRMGSSFERPAEVNQLYLDRLVRLLRESRFVDRAVLLALDGVYDQKGKWDRAKSHFLIPNHHLFDVVKRYPDLFLAGCSINPQREDALEEMERCAAAGAVLVKVLPNAQGFDPAHPGYRPFYQALVKHRLPLLCHVGKEFSVTSGHQDYGDPAGLEPLLDQGVTVIAAHGMSYGLFFYEKYWGTLIKFVRKYPRFYWDASALSLPNRVGMLLRVRRHPELISRMVFGTDYPLPTFAYPALLAGDVMSYLQLRRIRNPFDRHVRLLQSLGLQPTPLITHAG